MSSVEPTNKSADIARTESQVSFDRVGVVKATYPHTSTADGRTGAVDVRLVGEGDRTLKNIPVAAGFHGESWLPRKGQSVIIRWIHSDPPYPYVAQAVYTEKNPSPTAEAGTWAVETGSARGEIGRDSAIRFETGKGASITLDGDTVSISGDSFDAPGIGTGMAPGTQLPIGSTKPLPSTKPDAPPKKRAEQAGLDIRNTVHVTSMAEIAGDAHTLYVVDGNNGPLTHDGKHGLGSVRDVAICGKNGARLRIPAGFRDYSITSTGGNGLMWSGIDLDQRAKGAFGRLNLQVHTRGFYEYFQSIGSGRNPAATPANYNDDDDQALHFPVLAENGRARMKNVALIHGGMMGNSHSGHRAMGIFMGKPHNGTLTIIDSRIEEFPNNGIYAAAMSGTVHVRGGRYYNNNVCQIRLSNGSAKDVTAGYDYTKSGAANAKTPHGTKGIVANQKDQGRPGFFAQVKNCKVEFLNIVNSGGCINTYDNYGGAKMGTVIGCDFIDRSNATTINTDGGSIDAVKNCRFNKSKSAALAGNIGSTTGNKFNV